MISGLSDRYRVLSTVGSGGMGVVYKALDTSLNRPVAIKAIRPHRLDEQSASRLRAEARAAASLDHPYICKVYELIETTSETLIVMEFVEGETLSAKLARGRPPLEMTLLIGAEIAEGLAGAHARGVIHRDIKPSNVMITPHGHVKILDFGLARVLPRPESAGTTTTHTGSRPGTGSPAYMSPEQARGDQITAASDLFSLGVLLYECISGRLPFEGKTAYEYVASLLNDELVPLGSRAPEAPTALVHLVDRCLQKDPGWRPESAAVVGKELRQMLEQGVRTAPRAQLRLLSPKARWGTAAAAVLIVLLSLGLGWRAFVSHGSRELDAARETVPLVTWPSEEKDSRVSPDGRWFSFISDRDGTERLYVQRFEGEARSINIHGEVLTHVWSPDGKQIAAYVVTDTGRLFLQVVPAFFGDSVDKSLPLEERAPESARLVRWIDDDVYLSIDSTSGRKGRRLTRINLATGARSDVQVAFDANQQIEWIDVNPVTRRLVLAAVQNEQEDLWVAEPDGTRPRQITDDSFLDGYPLWSGSLVTFQSNRGGQIDLWQIDAESRRMRAFSTSETQEHAESSTIDGAIVTFQQRQANSRLWKLFPGSSRPDLLTNDALSDFAPSVSADGLTLVFQRQARTPSLGATLFDSQILLARSRDGTHSAEPAASTGFFPRVSPDGRLLAFFVRKSSGSPYLSLHIKDQVTGQIRTISGECDLPVFAVFPADWASQLLTWSSDGSLFFVERNEEGRVIRRFDPASGVSTNVTGRLRTRIADVHPSPDGSRVAYLLSHNRGLQLRLRTLSDGAEQVLGSWSGGAAVHLRGWRTTRDELIIVRRQVDLSDAHSLLMEVIAVSVQGARVLARVPLAYPSTARLSAVRDQLYFAGTRNRVHNIYALALGASTIRQLTSNELPNVTYSGIEPLADGSVIYAMNERRQDIWLSRTLPKGTGQ